MKPIYDEYHNDHRIYSLVQNGIVIYQGLDTDLREVVEQMLQQRIGYSLTLENMNDDGDFTIYLHSDNDEDISESIMERLDSEYGINTHDDEAAWFAIKELLSIEIR